MLARGAALRFLLTRLVDWLAVPDGALVKPKDPLEYFRKLRFHQSVKSVGDYGIEARERSSRVTIHTDGACSGNPGPGGWGAILHLRRPRKGIERRRAAHHQQPHGIDGGDLGAGSAQSVLASVDLYTDSEYLRGGITGWINGWKKNGWRTADKKPVKNVDLWKRLDAALEPP